MASLPNLYHIYDCLLLIYIFQTLFQSFVDQVVLRCAAIMSCRPIKLSRAVVIATFQRPSALRVVITVAFPFLTEVTSTVVPGIG